MVNGKTDPKRGPLLLDILSSMYTTNNYYYYYCIMRMMINVIIFVNIAIITIIVSFCGYYIRIVIAVCLLDDY